MEAKNTTSPVAAAVWGMWPTMTVNRNWTVTAAIVHTMRMTFVTKAASSRCCRPFARKTGRRKLTAGRCTSADTESSVSAADCAAATMTNLRNPNWTAAAVVADSTAAASGEVAGTGVAVAGTTAEGTAEVEEPGTTVGAAADSWGETVPGTMAAGDTAASESSAADKTAAAADRTEVEVAGSGVAAAVMEQDRKVAVGAVGIAAVGPAPDIAASQAAVEEGMRSPVAATREDIG
jgi:hypothetical protein